MKQTIFEHLTEEHVEFRKMMATLAEQYDEKLFGEFGDELERHQEAEEQTLYAVLRDDPSTRELVLEGIEEHNAATALLRKLQQQNGGTDTWMAKMTVLGNRFSIIWSMRRPSCSTRPETSFPTTRR